MAHFLLALSTPRAKRSVGAVVKKYLDRAGKSVMQPREFAQFTRVLLALAHGDEADRLVPTWVIPAIFANPQLNDAQTIDGEAA